jgi:DNA topoisomerase-3
VVIATDPDEEGEVIGRQILTSLGFKGNILRLWASALDPGSLDQALKNLLPLSATDTVYRAGCVRRQLDWLYGINLSRAFTLRSGKPTGIGRVKTRLLTELVNREKEIKRFTPRYFYAAEAKFQDVVLEWQAADPCRNMPLLSSAGNVAGICIAASDSREILNPPLPFTLSALLADAADRGMDLIRAYAAVQNLYEAGAISYPRTGSTAMPNVGAHGFAAHHAIINTIDACPGGLSEDARAIFRMVDLNCTMQMIGEATLNVRKLVFDIGGEIFSATDYWVDPRKPHDAGWLLCAPDRHTPLEKNRKTAMFKPGDQVNATLRVERKQTAPPERYTEASLLRHMACAGMGTEATRVDAINTLVQGQVAKRTQVNTKCSLELSPTESGMDLIEWLPPSVTGSDMESMLRNALKHVRNGQVNLSGHLLDAFKWLNLTIHGIG